MHSVEVKRYLLVAFDTTAAMPGGSLPVMETSAQSLGYSPIGEPSISQNLRCTLPANRLRPDIHIANVRY
jgi:hypothetical protein